MSNRSQWVHVLSPEEIEAHHARTARLDPRYAAGERRWFENASNDRLETEMRGAWLGNLPTTYQLCRSYLAKRGIDVSC